MQLNDKTIYQSLFQIRRFEETVLEYFPKGVFSGTTHTYLGQEANAVGVLSNLEAGDIVFSNHRCHGHFLAYGGDARALFAELMGKSSGVCAGRGGSQHLNWRNFYSNGIQGGIVPVAVGMALAEKRKGEGNIVIVFLGDGTLGEGVVYEALNMASLWQAPIFFVLENNQIAQTTPIESAVAGEIALRFEAFGIRTTELDTSDVMEIQPLASLIMAEIRVTSIPQALILRTNRFGAHSKGDDTRPDAEVSRIKELSDPITLHGRRLDEITRQEIEDALRDEIQMSFQSALSDPFPQAGD